MGFGMHHYLPENAEIQYMTMLRDPVKRSLSQYYYIKRRPNHFLYELVKKQSLLEFIKSEQAYAHCNRQTALLASTNCIPLNSENNRGLDKNDLRKAKEHLKKFTFVGILEEFDISMLLAKQILGWNNIYYFKRNVSKSKNIMVDIPPEKFKGNRKKKST